MSLVTNIQDLATRIATEFKAVYTKIGDLTTLTTTAKTSAVAAINEVAAAVGGAGATIDDTTPSTLTVYSSSKTASEIATAKSDILGGAGAAYDTLQELKALLDASDAADDAEIASILTALGNRLRFDAAQTLTAPQMVQGNTNLGSLSLVDAGSPTTNYVTTFEAGLL